MNSHRKMFQHVIKYTIGEQKTDEVKLYADWNGYIHQPNAEIGINTPDGAVFVYFADGV